MRKSHICPKCKHNHILLIARVADSHEHFRGSVAPLKVALFTSGDDYEGNPKYAAFGDLSAAVCRSCGYTEFQTVHPEAIPIDGKQVVEIIGPESDGPFR